MREAVCVITGATSGIGRAAAIRFAATGSRVILIGRNTAAGEAVVRRIRRSTGRDAAVFIRADLSAQDDVRRVAANISATHGQIDVLINNAGARYDRYRRTPDGREATFAGNHLGHYLLTRLLLDRLLSSPAPRIVTVSSSNLAPPPESGQWELTEDAYDRRRAYALSKSANLLFALTLADRLRNVPAAASNAFDPGGVASAFSRNNGLLPWVKHLLSHGMRRKLVTPATAAAGLVRAATAPECQGVSGRFLTCTGERPVPEFLRDPAAAEGLWDLSARMTRVDPVWLPAENAAG